MVENSKFIHKKKIVFEKKNCCHIFLLNFSKIFLKLISLKIQIKVSKIKNILVKTFLLQANKTYEIEEDKLVATLFFVYIIMRIWEYRIQKYFNYIHNIKYFLWIKIKILAYFD